MTSVLMRCFLYLEINCFLYLEINCFLFLITVISCGKPLHSVKPVVVINSDLYFVVQSGLYLILLNDFDTLSIVNAFIK